MKKNILYIVLFAISLLLLNACSKDGNVGNESPGTGKGGSLARFTIAQNHLYVVDGSTLYTYSLTDPNVPVKVSELQIGFNIETIYPYGNNLFIGSMDAMYIYSINTPSNPQFVATASHVRACDPVVANYSRAYVTVRTGNNCMGSVNALKVYDITNINYPTQVHEVNLSNPHGLGLHDSGVLYVCDAGNGLVIFNTNVGDNLVQQGKITGEVFFDCIPLDNILICMIEGGMAIYDISTPLAPVLVSKI